MRNIEDIRLEDFCVMEEFYRLLKNWTNTTGISTTVVDMEGKTVIPSFGTAEYCSRIQSCEAGRIACNANLKENRIGLYECHAGFFDFAIPIETPSGQQLGRVLAGQVLSDNQPIETIITKAEKYQLTSEVVCDLVNRTQRRSQKELESIYNLLKQMVDLFIEKSYQKWYESKQLFDVVATAGTGLWRITKKPGEKETLNGSDKMLELLGLEHPGITDEERYENWHERVNKSEIASLESAFSDMMNHVKTENVYLWNHPTLGERYIRCGGIGDIFEDGRWIVSGYHTDITDIVSKENKQKQLLSKALSETKYQKELLQKALDNYKQADYDRRTDFLTGLRNRHDMYEMLNDEMSLMREQLKAAFMMDVDDFKLFNDNYGHMAGDDCLRRIGEALNKYGKENNVKFFRYGGEELIGFSLSSEKSASEIADELVKLISDLKIVRNDVKENVVTVSLGYTTDVSDVSKMIDQADIALYESKSKGKNQASCYKKS